MPLVTVYTVNINGYDAFRPPLYKSTSPDVEYVYFTDQDYKTESWKVQHIDNLYNPQQASRLVKCLPHMFFPNSAFTIYHDANMSIMVDPKELINRFMTEWHGCPEVGGAIGIEKDIALFAHPSRTNIEQEGLAVRGKGVPLERSSAMIQSFRDAGFNVSEGGLFEGGVIVRRNSPKVNRMNVSWWTYVSLYCHRDQMTLPFVMWLHEIKYNLMPGDYVQNDYFDYLTHVTSVDHERKGKWKF